MSRFEMMRAVENVNKLVDEMAKYRIDSKAYANLDTTLHWLLDLMTNVRYNPRTDYCLKYSSVTGHYSILFV